MLKKTLKYILIFTVTSLCLIYAFLEYYPVCKNTVIEETSLTYGKKFVVFDRGCGATTADSTHGSIMNIGSNISANDVGNIFVADFGRFTIQNEDRTVKIASLEEVKFYKKADKYIDFEIIFE